MVHGRDTARRDEVQAYVQELTGIRPTVLANEPNGGMTIIEKFELHAAASAFAIVLLTPDDFGGIAGGTTQPRARQNVIFEMGYFTGRLARARVFALNAGVEQPSDLDGLLYIRLDGDWKQFLRREMKAAGLPIAT